MFWLKVVADHIRPSGYPLVMPNLSPDRKYRTGGVAWLVGVVHRFLFVWATLQSVSQSRLFYGCSDRFHLSGDNSRDRCINAPLGLQ